MAAPQVRRCDLPVAWWGDMERRVAGTRELPVLAGKVRSCDMYEIPEAVVLTE